MIKIKDLDKILSSVLEPEVKKCSASIFEHAMKSKDAINEFVVDFSRMGLSSTTVQNYYQEGLKVLMPAVDSKKKLDISQVSQAYVIYTGLLNHEFVIGYEPAKNMETCIYTKSEKLLTTLYKAGAFDNVDKYNKSMKALFGENGVGFGNKVVASFEKNSLALGRLDIVSIIGDEVCLDLTIPTKFREDYGTGLILMPYSIFPYLSESLSNFVNNLPMRTITVKNKVKRTETKIEDIRGVTVLQKEVDGNVKTRKATFSAKELVKAYNMGAKELGLTGEEFEDYQEMVNSQVKKTKLGWDCLKKQIRAFNVEASIYSVPYTVIKLERLMKLTPCTLTNIDTSMYLIDFDEVRRLFTSRINNWRISEFEDFGNIVNTNECANIDERKMMLNRWADGIDDADLYKIMKSKGHLFERMKDGSSKSIDDGLADMYKRKPKAQKSLKWVDLESNMDARKNQLKNLLSKGVCKIESVSSRTGAPRTFIATNNEDVLSAAYGENQRLAYESPKRSIKQISELVTTGKIQTLTQFITKLQTAGIDGIVNYGGLSENASQHEYLSVLNDALIELENTDRARGNDSGNGVVNVYLVNFRRVNAENENEYYGCVDVRNIESVMFGEQKSK